MESESKTPKGMELIKVHVVEPENDKPALSQSVDIKNICNSNNNSYWNNSEDDSTIRNDNEKHEPQSKTLLRQRENEQKCLYFI